MKRQREDVPDLPHKRTKQEETIEAYPYCDEISSLFRSIFFLYHLPLHRDLIHYISFILTILSKPPSHFPYTFNFKNQYKPSLVKNLHEDPTNICSPWGITVGSKGNLYVSDISRGRILVYSAEPPRQLLFSFGEEEADIETIELKSPHGLCVDRYFNILICDNFHKRIQVRTHDGIFLRHIRLKGPPRDVTIDHNGRIIVSQDHFISVLNKKGQEEFKIGSEGKNQGQFTHPTGVAVDQKNNIFVCDSFNQRIQIFNPQGEFLQSIGSPPGEDEGNFYPWHLVFDGDGNFFVSNGNSPKLLFFSNELKFVSMVGIDQAASGCGLTADKDGNLFATDSDKFLLFLENAPDKRLESSK